ncbi:LysR family transcriptional regulator [Pseudomonas sp. JS3066]|uniref:LysR family transcriptional regulator n=1 Tax=unclassified Pseudomonas TaxID=196821 RepID=UPI000EAAC5FD|nr:MULTISPECIES: LysR family transcriptional regulator [unclassified Pseudomonas]AYF86392.1 LysR family transcriptional regulator [Pseudomonas sp. DY-1]MRK23725.1 LysR family transcriptional regulator [Pseudomonas sp. JG-B]WVK96156.1 LysR family transcriptional regulator [Pseudomonas sp. JS3066]
MDRFQEMKVLVVVAEAGSFAAGAKQLGLSPPSVTRAIAALEARLGTLLLARSTRSVRLTEAGRRYVEDCRRILLELEEAEELASGSALRPRGNLTVTAPVIFGELYMVPLIADYLAAHAEVTINAMLVDRVVNMIDEGVDVALRIGQLPEGDLTALKVGEVRQVICAAPAFLESAGRPATPADLLGAPVVMSSASSLLTDWQFIGPEGPITQRPQARFVVSSNNAAIHAARRGWGYTRVLSYQVAEAVARGELEIVLEQYSIPPLPIHLLHQGGTRVSAKVRTFVDHCFERLRNDPALQAIAAE